MVRVDGEAVVFRVFKPNAERVELVGSFTGWSGSPILMTKGAGGWHRASVKLSGGDYEFQYLVDGREWLADYAAGGVRLNTYGQWVSQLHVPEAGVVMTRGVSAGPGGAGQVARSA